MLFLLIDQLAWGRRVNLYRISPAMKNFLNFLRYMIAAKQSYLLSQLDYDTEVIFHQTEKPCKAGFAV